MSGGGRLGFRILPAGPRLADQLVARFHGLASANVADAMGRFNFMDAGIRARTGRPVAGRALTVVCRPGDIVVGDEDGVAVVPHADAEAVLRGVEDLVAREAQRVHEIRTGTVFRPDVDETLRRKGVVGS